MYGSYGLDTMRATPAVTTGVWTIVAFVLALVGAFVAYFLFVKPEKKYPNKFVTWLRNFLNFQEMLIEPILKVTYLFLALFVTLASFELIGTSFLGFLLTLVLGNLLIRIIYESSMILIGIWKNTREMNRKMK